MEERVPWVLNGRDLGSTVLELGPGPGLTTDILHAQASNLTVLEIEAQSATSLERRFQNTDVNVVVGDATVMPFPDASFSTVVSFTMLHHVASPLLQDELFRQVHRVLKPGGNFLGCDSLQNWLMRVIHIGDTWVPVAPETIAKRLEDAGFETVDVEVGTAAFRFNARKPYSKEDDEEIARKNPDSSILHRIGRETRLMNNEGDANVHH